MAIKVIKKKQKGKPKYPYFGRFNDGTIVFYAQKETGV